MKTVCLLPLAVLLATALSAQASSAADLQQLRRDYVASKEGIAKQRALLAERYHRAATEQQRESLLGEGRRLVLETLAERILPAWDGTPWGFYGVTRTPGEGQIACGTFVVFTLQDAGFRIPSRMADQPSENILKNLVGTAGLRRFTEHAPMSAVIEWLKKSGEGLYVVGLDIHVGFVIYQKERIEFCHASYYQPRRVVVSQGVLDRSPLTDAQYRVFGKLLTKEMLRKWLEGESFPVTFDHFRRSPRPAKPSPQPPPLLPSDGPRSAEPAQGRTAVRPYLARGMGASMGASRNAAIIASAQSGR